MGASAGRVLIIPKGDWNAETTYTGLDMVRHNGASWICKNTCTNIEPTEANSANWQMMSRDGNDVTVDSAMSDDSVNAVQNKVIKKYVDEHTPEIADMTGASSTQNGAHGLVPAPKIGDEKKALLGDGTWGSVDAIFTYKTKEEYDAAVANGEIPDGAKVIKEYDEGDSTAIIDIDSTMSDTSVNPVQNKVIKKYVDDHAPNITVDSEMSDTSVNPVQNKVIKAYVDTHAPAITVDSEMSDTSVNPVQNKVIKAYADAKKVPSIAIENIFTGNPFITSGSGLATFKGTEWDIDNGGYRIIDIKYTAGSTVNATVNLLLPANSIVVIDVNTLNAENIDVQGSCIKHNFTSSVQNGNMSISFTGRAAQTLSDIRYMPIVMHLG